MEREDRQQELVEANAKAAKLWFGRSQRLDQGAWSDGDSLHMAWQGQDQTVMSVAELLVPGAHNVENALAAIAACAVKASNR